LPGKAPALQERPDPAADAKFREKVSRARKGVRHKVWVVGSCRARRQREIGRNGGVGPTVRHNGGSCPDVPCRGHTASQIVLALSKHSLSFAMTNPEALRRAGPNSIVRLSVCARNVPK
jgi:hypothetical protein